MASFIPYKACLSQCSRTHGVLLLARPVSFHRLASSQCAKWLPRDLKEGMPPSEVSIWLSRNGWHLWRLGINCCVNCTELFFKISQGPVVLIWAHWRADDTLSPFKLAPRRLVLSLLVTAMTAHRGCWPQSVPSKYFVRILTSSAKVLPTWIR